MRVAGEQPMMNGRLRKLLLTSVAGLCLGAMAGAAQAQSGEVSPQGGVLNWSDVERAPQIVIGAPGTPTTARDPEDVTGVGQMIIDQQNGFIGLCTATLINPRTVIFAAHCVNDRAPGDYGAATGGAPIGFGFSSNNNAPGASAFGQWLNSGYQTNTDRYMYNSNYVTYHPASLEPDAASFLYGDVAMASLDTVATDVPSWAMLFSALPATEITANGTGYHVALAGYGNNGTGSTGSNGGIDYRRRLAENMLGALASLDQFESFLFGGSGGVNPQNLYWIDFDDTRRGTPQADIRDFNAWRDNPQPNEGITASGDSGGPLILDQEFDSPVVIGVLSGGYTRFFNGQPANGYGTASFFQPLYLYWDWIAANNPYRYVSALAGDGDWTDASHWVSDIDPNYQIIGPDGQLVNGVPTDLGEGPNGTDGSFGQACFEGPINGGFADCQDMATGAVTSDVRPIGTGASNGSAIVSTDSLLGEGGQGGVLGFNDGVGVPVALDAEVSPAAQVGVAALPPATVANGLPGATGFVPNNTDGDRLADIPPRYFDVTLSANGTTTLDTDVTVDRLTMAGIGAGLDITSTGSLFSNIDITQLTGTLNVDGALGTSGDFFMMTGGLSGSGTITTPFFTNMAGVIAPGTPTSIGTLTFDGNLILASGSTLLINLGASGSSDLVAVTGQADLGGLVAFSFVSTPTYGSSYTFLTADGGLTGGFDAAPISAILMPEITYSLNSVSVQIAANAYADVVSDTSAIQQAYAQLLDQNRVLYDQFADVFGPLDAMDAPSIQATLDALAPRTEALRTAMGTSAVDGMGNFYRDRMNFADAEGLDGSFEVIGRPVDYASAAVDSLDGGSISPVGDNQTTVVPGALPDGMRGFIAAGYLDGKGAPMATAPGGGEDEFDGYFIATGLEAALGRQGVIGLALSTTDLSGSTAVLPQAADGQLWLATLYGNYQSDAGLTFNSQFSFGRFDTTTERQVVIGPNTFTLRAEDEVDVLAGEIGLGYRISRDQFTVTPGASLRASAMNYGPTVETGGGPALVYHRDDSNSVESRLGFTVAGVSPTFRPWATANYVHALDDQPAAFGANFVGGVGPDALFALASDDQDWFEVGVGLEAIRDTWRFTVGAESTLGRDNVESQSYRAAVSFRF